MRHGSSREEEQLQPDRPLQRVRIDLVLIGERGDAAAGLVLGVGVHPLGPAEARDHVGERRVRRHARRLAEHHLADVGADVRVGVHVLGDLLRPRRRVLARLAARLAVAVELDVRDMGAMAFGDPHRVQGGGVVAGMPEVVAMDVRGMRQPELVHRLDERPDHLPGRQLEGLDLLVETSDVGVAAALPGLVAPGIHELRGVRLGDGEPPRERVAQVLPPALLQQLVEQHVVAHQHVEALVDDGRVVEFLQRVARADRRHRRFHRGGVAEQRVAVAGREGGGHGAADPGAGEGGARMHVVPVVLRFQLAREVHLRAGDVAVDVDSTRHDHESPRVDPSRLGRHVAHDPAVGDAYVADLAVDAVGRIVNAAVRDAQHDRRQSLRRRARRGPGPGSPRAARAPVP